MLVQIIFFFFITCTHYAFKHEKEKYTYTTIKSNEIEQVYLH